VFSAFIGVDQGEAVCFSALRPPQKAVLAISLVLQGVIDRFGSSRERRIEKKAFLEGEMWIRIFEKSVFFVGEAGELRGLSVEC